VPKFDVNPYEFQEVDMIRSRAGTEETKELRDALLASYRVPIVDLVHTTKDMLGEFRALKATLASPWADAPKLAPSARDRAEARKYFK